VKLHQREGGAVNKYLVIGIPGSIILISIFGIGGFLVIAIILAPIVWLAYIVIGIVYIASTDPDRSEQQRIIVRPQMARAVPVRTSSQHPTSTGSAAATEQEIARIGYLSRRAMDEASDTALYAVARATAALHTAESIFHNTSLPPERKHRLLVELYESLDDIPEAYRTGVRAIKAAILQYIKALEQRKGLSE
jgi:hypothetical protein